VLRRRFRYYLEAPSDDAELGRQHLQDIEDIAQELADCLDKGAASENILLATYASSYGSEGAISLVGSHAIREIYFLLTFSLTVNEIQAGGSNEARKLTDHYSHYVTRIAKATQDQIQACRETWTSHAEDLLTKSIFPNAVLDWSGGYISNAKAFGLALKKNWPQFDWSILVYDQCGGFDRHGFTATGEIWVKPYLRQVCKDGTQPDVDEDKLGANCGNIIVTAVRSEQPRYRPNVDADVRAAFNYLTLWERAVYVGLEECTALKTFRTYGKGFYFYCLREDEVGGVRLGYWSAAASAPELDEAKGIGVYNQGTVQIGRILKSEINQQDSDVYYYTLHVWA
jgi:hypothetical protein